MLSFSLRLRRVLPRGTPPSPSALNTPARRAGHPSPPPNITSSIQTSTPTQPIHQSNALFRVRVIFLFVVCHFHCAPSTPIPSPSPPLQASARFCHPSLITLPSVPTPLMLLSHFNKPASLEPFFNLCSVPQVPLSLHPTKYPPASTRASAHWHACQPTLTLAFQTRLASLAVDSLLKVHASFVQRSFHLQYSLSQFPT